MSLKKLFIGSSSEEYHLAEAIQTLLTEKFEITMSPCTIWDHETTTLCTELFDHREVAHQSFDYAIIIGSDETFNIKSTTRSIGSGFFLSTIAQLKASLKVSKCVFITSFELADHLDLIDLSVKSFIKSDIISFVDTVKSASDFLTEKAFSPIK